MMAERKPPPDWRWVRFGDVVREVRAATRDPEAEGLSRVVGLEHLDSESLRLRRWNELADLPDGTSFTRVFRAGQVLFGKRRAYQRKVAVSDFDGLCSSDILVFEPVTDDLLPEFLPYIVQSDGFFDHALGTSAGSLSPRTKWQELAKYEFALPPVSEQGRLFDVLDGVRVMRDRYVEAGSAAARTLDIVRLHLIDADSAGPMMRLGDLVDFTMGKVYPSADYGESGVRLLRPGNIAPTGFLEWTGPATVHLPERYSDAPGSVLLAAGDIVMNLTAQSLEDGFLGRVCMARDGDESIVNQRIARIRTSDLPAEYLFRVFQHPLFRRHVDRCAKGSKIKHLYWRDLAQFLVPMPTELRVRQVVTQLNAAEQVMLGATAAATSAHALLGALSSALLTGSADV